MAPKKISGFLSYSSLNDKTQAVTKFRRQLENELANVCGYEVPVFQDHEALKTGQDWEQKIFERIELADFMVCIVTQGFIISDMCARELEVALQNRKRVFPIYWYRSRYFEDVAELRDLEPRLKTQYRGVVQSIKRLQYRDFRRLRTMNPTAITYISEVSKLAEEIETEVTALSAR